MKRSHRESSPVTLLNKVLLSCIIAVSVQSFPDSEQITITLKRDHQKSVIMLPMRIMRIL